jgi:hypothetical protein
VLVDSGPTRVLRLAVVGTEDLAHPLILAA